MTDEQKRARIALNRMKKEVTKERSVLKTTRQATSDAARAQRDLQHTAVVERANNILDGLGLWESALMAGI